MSKPLRTRGVHCSQCEAYITKVKVYLVDGDSLLDADVKRGTTAYIGIPGWEIKNNVFRCPRCHITADDLDICYTAICVPKATASPDDQQS